MIENLTQLIGNTPLVRVPLPLPAPLYAKLEYLNPSGSIKDRSAIYMIEEAERLGLLKPGGTLIEATSGNQGIAVSMIGRLKGYRVIITVPERISLDKRRTMQAYGAEVIVCPPSDSIEDPYNYRNYAKYLQSKIPNSFMPNQYFNLSNPAAHYASLGPEIWTQSQGRVTHFVTAAGTGGTLSGAGRFLKEQSPDIKVIGVDVATSFRSTGGHPKPYTIEGIGVDFHTPCLNQDIVDEFVSVTDAQALDMMHEMGQRYGMLIGTASSASCYALANLLEFQPGDCVVTVFSDSGRAYLADKYWPGRKNAPRVDRKNESLDVDSLIGSDEVFIAD